MKPIWLKTRKVSLITLGTLMICVTSACRNTDEQISVSCNVVETITSRNNGVDSFPEKRPQELKSFRFFQEKKIVDEFLIEDLRNGAPFLHGNQVQKVVWVAEVGGRTVYQKDHTVIGPRYKREINNGVSVDQTWLSVFERAQRYEEGKRKMSNEMTVKINRLTGSLEGYQLDIFHDIKQSFLSEFKGMCQKVEQKF